MPSLDEARAWYPQEDPVHGFDHVLRVLRMAERLAERLGADLEVVRAACLLHDAAGAVPGADNARASHEAASAHFAEEVLAREGWPPERIEAVTHCIRSHRFRGAEAPATLEAQIVFDADKLDVLGAFGVARTIGYALQAGQPVYAAPSPEFRGEGKARPGEPHSAYHEYLFKLRNVADRLYTEPARAIGARRGELLERFLEALAAEADGSDA
jgi:uncharacterized protein